jgi:hypothetical protein
MSIHEDLTIPQTSLLAHRLAPDLGRLESTGDKTSRHQCFLAHEDGREDTDPKDLSVSRGPGPRVI